MSAEQFIAKIDSATTMLQAVANFLRRKPLAGLGFVPPSRALSVMANLPPRGLRQYVYIFGGRREAALPRQLLQLRAEEVSRWVVRKFPKRPYPAVMIGSSNGALVHLCAALQIPWLPQTVLVPVRRRARINPDEFQDDVEAFREPARRLLDRNPEWQINQMHDPIQDRLMVQQMGYFRIKRLHLGETYERFLTRCLPPGGTLLVAECTYRWPMTQLGPRHLFQVGGYGGLEPTEYLQGSRRVASFLRAQRADRRRWEPPRPDVERPESEWGFEPALLDDLRRIAKRRGYRLQRLVFRDPADASPFVADLYRWWYARRGLPTRRLFAESFLLLEPWWCLRTGSIPFWKVFNTGRSAEALRHYIRRRGPFNEIYLTLFANAIKGIDQTSIREWKAILRQARTRGAFIGVDEDSYPYDLGVYFRFHPDLQETITARLPFPAPLTLAQLNRFRARAPARYRLRWRR